MRAWLDQARLFQLRSEAGRSREVEDSIAQEIVPLGTVPVTRADKAVVAVFVQNPVAKGTQFAGHTQISKGES